jgi:hypothetical protein
MSSKAGTLGAQRGPVFGPREWTIIVTVALVACAALVMSVVALQRGATSTTTTVPRHAAVADRSLQGIYERSQPVTGTGPGLVAVADASILQNIYERSAPVTGTGPDLTFVADQSALNGIYQRSQPVTGTGPDLAVVGANAMTERIYKHSGPVTGTGPGLEHVGDHS